jgi:hypothetical protein
MKLAENFWQAGSAKCKSVEDAAIYLICFREKAALVPKLMPY